SRAHSVPSVLYFSVLFCLCGHPPWICPLSLHDALPICASRSVRIISVVTGGGSLSYRRSDERSMARDGSSIRKSSVSARSLPLRSEEHTSELQSRVDLVCRLLLEKKKNTRSVNRMYIIQ